MAKKRGTITLKDIKSKVYNRVGLQSPFKNVIGDICMPTYIMLYGRGGSGKSTFSLLLAEHLDSLGYPVYYVAAEQIDSPTFIEIFERNNIELSDNVVFDSTLKNYGWQPFVFIDSKDAINWKVEDLKAFKKKHPNTSVILTSQGTKAGSFTGKEIWRNELDALLLCDQGKLSGNSDKNRWGGAGKIKVY